jgi:DNA-directed RNA polymerase subunit RPC12/RpoP
MSILDIFKRKEKDLPKKIGNTEPICPYCSKPLERMPAKKKKCPGCGNFIFVRTRPSDNEKVLVTEAQTETIKVQWAIANGTHEEYLRERAPFEDIKERLTKQHGFEPSDSEVKWVLLSEQQLDRIRKGNWGLYSCTVLGMADVLKAEEKLKNALNTYLEVFYLDLHGPINLEGAVNRPGFDSQRSLIAPRVVNQIAALVERLSVVDEEIENMLKEITDKRCSFISKRISAAEAHERLKAALAEREKLLTEIKEKKKAR